MELLAPTPKQNTSARPIIPKINRSNESTPSQNALTLRDQNLLFRDRDNKPDTASRKESPRKHFLNHTSPHGAQDRQRFPTGPRGAWSQHKMQVPTHVERWRDWKKLSVILESVPRSWGTREIHQLLLRHNAHPDRIDMSYRPGNAKVIFRPPPRDAAWWINRGLPVSVASGTTTHIRCRAEQESEADRDARQRGDYEELAVSGRSLGFGIMKDTNALLIMQSIPALIQISPRLVLNTKKRHVELQFSLQQRTESGTNAHSFIFRIPFAEIRHIMEDRDDEDNTVLIIPMESPPLAFRKASNWQETHHVDADVWDDWQTWYRQTGIELDCATAASRRTQLRNEDFYIDVGRWLCYRFVCTPESQAYIGQLRVVLAKNNIPINRQSVQCTSPETRSQWSWLGTSSHDLANNTAMHLPFTVQYQLEACISHGCLHESNVTITFLERLLDQDKDPHTSKVNPKYPRATKLLEKALESKQRFYDPMQIFHLGTQVSLVQKHIPSYCTLVRSATVTATTIYFHSPSVDTSNRVIRKFREYEDRFLRVKFRDETYRGRIMTFDDDTSNELFTRVKRVLQNGIGVGDRHYEFLAYGNSQFREHGAYFFAPTSTMTTEMMRKWMGNFDGIKTVAKYASRIGQCFSTSRAVSNGVKIDRIPDIERNGYCFTDGVGKISMLSLQMAAQDMKLLTCPSVIQFRLGGCKGVLACDPELKGQVIEVRPSQEKFPAPYKGLEICRVSQFATAYLNQQVVLVLSSLGVPDEIFLVMLRRMLSRLEQAMSDETVAMDLLLGNIDLNQSTVELASMIKNGFMTVQEPFLVSNMRLWRSWSIKYLKEKAKIFVEKGAFVMGNIDETGILKGHTDCVAASDMTHNVDALPEIFLQVEDAKNKGTWKAIEAVCVLLRNPSLHPGDSRVVKAVNVPELRHLRDCVVLPSKGDRDIAGMCSGGDLDGDDYLVIWDPDLIPSEWNHAPMDYTAPTPINNEDPVTIDDMTSFFGTHMKYDNLGRIATAHRYWADWLDEGVKHEHCLELAALHSKAVDYAKTGVAADMPKHLKVKSWPHWAEKEGKRSYKSKKILGRMYDEVARVPFEPAWSLSFDERILDAFELDDYTLSLAREVKCEYDEAIRRLMRQHGVRTEFEIWTTFVMDHNHESRDFKIAEELGETIVGLKKQFQDLCYEKAGTNATFRDWDKVKLFVAAMYTVTAQEVTQADKECSSKHLSAGRYVPDRERTPESMPLMSFPWLFARELGDIATRRNGSSLVHMPMIYAPASSRTTLKTTIPSISTASDNAMQALESLPLVEVKEPGRKDSMELLHHETATPAAQKSGPEDGDSPSCTAKTFVAASPDAEVLDKVMHESSMFDDSDRRVLSKEFAEINALPAEPSGNFQNDLLVPLPRDETATGAVAGDEDSEDGEEVEVQLEIEESTALDQLEAWYG